MGAETNDGSTLEQQLRLIEDRFEIFNLIASNPPSAEFPGLPDERRSPAGSANPEHYRSIEQGIAHFASVPYVRITGDTAFAIYYLQILIPDRVGAL